MFIRQFLKDEAGQYLIELLEKARDEYIKARKELTEPCRAASDFTQSLIEKTVEYSHFEEAYTEQIEFLQKL